MRYIALKSGVTLKTGLGLFNRNFVKVFDADKTRMIRLPYGEKTMTICKPFSSDTGTLRTDRRTDRRNRYINIARQCADAR